MVSFTFHAASLAFAIADTMSFTNAVKTKLFKGGDLSSFVNILNSGAGYWFVIFTSEINAFSCFRVLVCLHDMLSSVLFLNGLSDYSSLSIGFLLVHLRIASIDSLNSQFYQLQSVLTNSALIPHRLSNVNRTYACISFNLPVLSSVLMWAIRRL